MFIVLAIYIIGFLIETAWCFFYPDPQYNRGVFKLVFAVAIGLFWPWMVYNHLRHKFGDKNDIDGKTED
jgi:hypothetical protein